VSAAPLGTGVRHLPAGAGCDSRPVQGLLGREHVETTMVHAHALNRGGRGAEPAGRSGQGGRRGAGRLGRRGVGLASGCWQEAGKQAGMGRGIASVGGRPGPRLGRHPGEISPLELSA